MHSGPTFADSYCYRMVSLVQWLAQSRWAGVQLLSTPRWTSLLLTLLHSSSARVQRCVLRLFRHLPVVDCTPSHESLSRRTWRHSTRVVGPLPTAGNGGCQAASAMDFVLPTTNGGDVVASSDIAAN